MGFASQEHQRTTSYTSADAYGENIGNSSIFPRWEGGAFKFSDEKLREDVSEALYRNQCIDATEIEVYVERGSVYLRGLVDTTETRKMAEECIENISGVVEIENELELRH